MSGQHIERFLERSRQTMRDPQLQQALESAAERLRIGRETAFAELGGRGQALRQQARTIRERTMAHLDEYLERLAGAVERAGGVVHWADDSQEVCRIVADLARERGVRLAVKSKSMATEEINLREALQEHGVEVIETDLGERIIQLAHERPYHILAPAFHKTRHQVADLFTELGHDGNADIAVLNQFARAHLREKFIAADMGISGVNFAVAETGTLIVVTNEGNGRLVTGLPRIHVAVMGVEKVVPTWEDVAVLLQLLARSATGQKQSSYVTCVTGPRRQGERDGPEEMHLIIMDNGRSRVLGSDFREALYCIRCGACFNVCPVYREIGGHAYGSIYSGPIGSVLTPLFQGLDDFAALPQASSLCGACLEACPVHVDIPRMLLALREEEVKAGQGSWIESLSFRLYVWLAGHSTLFRLAARVGSVLQRPFVRDGRIARAPFPLSNWTAHREFPSLAARPFHDRWEELQ